MAIILSFWIFGAAITRYFLVKPRVQLIIQGDQARLRELWLFRHRDERFALLDCGGGVQIVEGKDSDGDPYFRLQMTTPSGRALTVAEHQFKSEVEVVYDRVIAVMNQLQPYTPVV